MKCPECANPETAARGARAGGQRRGEMGSDIGVFYGRMESFETRASWWFTSELHI